MTASVTNLATSSGTDRSNVPNWRAGQPSTGVMGDVGRGGV